MDTRVVTGVAATVRALKGMVKSDAPKIDEGLQSCAKALLKKMLYYVPRDTEALAKSHRSEVTGKGLAASLEVGSGGPEAPYAGYVHEMVHLRHAAPTCARWMSRSVRELQGTMASIVKRHLESGAVASFGG
jgi:hypothetical protein